MADLVARAYDSVFGWLARGHASHRHAHARLVRDPRVPFVWDANLVAEVRARVPEEIDAVLAAADAHYADFDHRCYFWDPRMPAEFEARLVLEGYEPRGELVLALEGELAQRGPAVELRAVESDTDWAALEALCRLDHDEEVTLGFHEPWSAEVTRQIVLAKRLKGPDVRYLLARVDGVDCAFFSGWPGDNGVGQVEDLFTRAEFRGRGIATALIAACVDDARARGAGPVLIAARANDTPKQMYAALGFRPLCVQRIYSKTGFKPQT